MSYQEFTKDIKGGKIRGTVFIYGEENFLIRWAEGVIVSRLVPENLRDINVTEFYGSDPGLTVQQILRAAGTYSMMGGRRVVIVHDFPPLYKKADAVMKSELPKIIDFAKSGQDTSILVFTLDSTHSSGTNAFRRDLKKAAMSYEMTRLKRPGIRGFVSKRLKDAGKFISGRDMEYLIDMTGYFYRDSEYSLDDLQSDMVKIISASEGTEITRDVIDDLLTGDDDRFVFNLIDALVARDRKKAMKMVADILSRDPNAAIPLTGLLTKQFEMMYDGLQMDNGMRSIGAMAKELGINEFRFKKAFAAARKFGSDKLRELLIELYNMDRNLKTGEMDEGTALELFILDV